MRTVEISSNSKTKAILILVGSMAAVVLLLCLVFHLTPLGMWHLLADYAAHHYFVIGFISLLFAVACWRIYTTLDEELETRFQKKNIPHTRLRKKGTSVLKTMAGRYFKTKIEESAFVKPETLNQLKFMNEDVLKDSEAIKQRQRDIQKAMVLGNSFKQKVILLFKDKHSPKHLITTVWSADDKHISLKGGVTLPVSSVYKIEI